MMSCTQTKQLVKFPKVRVPMPWIRRFNNDKTFRNQGTLHLFSLVSLYSYANFRSHTARKGGLVLFEKPGQWTCNLSALPRILRVESIVKALELMDYFRAGGFLDYRLIEGKQKMIQYTIAQWNKYGVHLDYNYYSYKSSGFFFFPLVMGRRLISASRRRGTVVFSELDAVADMWLHTIVKDPDVMGSEAMPVLYYADMNGKPLLSYSYLAGRWGWSKSRVGRFILRLQEEGLIQKISFASSYGTVISMDGYREMLCGDDMPENDLEQISDILNVSRRVLKNFELDDIEIILNKPVPSRKLGVHSLSSLEIQVFRSYQTSAFEKRTSIIFYTGLDCTIADRGEKLPDFPLKENKQKGADCHEQRFP